MKLSIKEFRNNVDFLQDQMNVHWHAARGKDEKKWCIESIQRRLELCSTMELKRNNAEALADRVDAVESATLFIIEHADWVRIPENEVTEADYNAVLKGSTPRIGY